MPEEGPGHRTVELISEKGLTLLRFEPPLTPDEVALVPQPQREINGLNIPLHFSGLRERGGGVEIFFLTMVLETSSQSKEDYLAVVAEKMGATVLNQVQDSQ